MNRIQIGCFQSVGWHVFTSSFMHFCHFIIVPEMKPILHFMLVCRADLYQPFWDLISVRASHVPDYR